MLSCEIEIKNPSGLHARASVKLTRLAGRFSSEVFLARDGRKVNANSVLGIMMLAASKGTKVAIEIDGSDENEAMEAFVELIEDELTMDDKISTN